MSSSPKRQGPSQYERQLAQISQRQANESSRILAGSAPAFVAEATRDRTRQATGQANADMALNAPQHNRADAFTTATNTNAQSAGRTAALIGATRGAQEQTRENTANALRAGQGLSQTALSGISTAAQIAHNEGQQAMQRRTARQQTNMGAVGTLAGAGVYAQQNQLGVFAQPQTPTPQVNPMRTGSPALLV